MRTLGLLASALVTLFVASLPYEPAAAQEKKLTDVLAQFTFKVRGDYGFLFLAKDRGYFKQEGLNVSFREGQGAGLVLTSLANDDGNTIGIALLDQVAAGITKGLPIISVAAWQFPSPSALVARPGISLKTPKDLIGKRIAVMQGQNASIIIEQFLRSQGIKPDQVTIIGLDAAAARAAFLKGDADIKDEFITDGVPVLEDKMGAKLDTLLFGDWGFKDIGLGAVVSKRLERTNPDLIKRFLRAASRGVDDMIADPAAAAKVVKAAYGSSLAGEPVILQQAREANRIIPPKEDGHLYGWIAPQRWDDQLDVLEKTGVIKKRLPASDYFTNAFVE